GQNVPSGGNVPPTTTIIPDTVAGPLLAWHDMQNINLLANVGINDADPIGTIKNAATTGATYDLIQAAAGKRSLFRKVADGTKINGLSAIESVGGGKHYQSNAFTLVAQPITWMWVFRNTATGTQVIASGGAANTNQTHSQVTAINMFAGTTQAPALNITANIWQTLIVRYDGAAATATLNGATVSGFGNVGALGIDQIGMLWNPAESAGADFIGFMAEQAIWTGNPSVAAIIAYANAKYGANPQ
ncbi:MAG TPA: hypothetical protein VFH73_23200, partial [Polyangia bacterium]|nr:hypothetical protein [Polyangia bacterium]